MKEKYFTEDTIDTQSNIFLESIIELRNKKDWKFKKSNVALLILDMQKFFFEETSHAFIPSAPSIIPNILTLMKVFHENNLPVIITKHINDRENAGQMSKWWKDLITITDSKSKFCNQLTLTGEEILITKTQYDSFYQTDLKNSLEELGIKQVIISGVMTHLCCESTARSAFTNGFEVFFLIDGTATYTKSFHQATLLNLAHGFAVPVLTKEIITEFE